MPQWLYDQVEVVVTLIVTVVGTAWAVGKTIGRLSTKVEDGFELNHTDHGRIIEKLDTHAERIARIETAVEDHRERYP